MGKRVASKPTAKGRKLDPADEAAEALRLEAVDYLTKAGGTPHPPDAHVIGERWVFAINVNRNLGQAVAVGNWSFHAHRGPEEKVLDGLRAAIGGTVVATAVSWPIYTIPKSMQPRPEPAKPKAKAKPKTKPKRR